MPQVQTSYTFVDSDNTNGTALGADNEDITVWKLIIGNPIADEVIRIYDIQNPVDASTTNLAFELTLPSTLPNWNEPTVVDFGPHGMRLGEGGAIQVDAAVAATVIWSRTG